MADASMTSKSDQGALKEAKIAVKEVYRKAAIGVREAWNFSERHQFEY